VTEQPGKRRTSTRPATRTARPPARPVAAPGPSPAQIREIEDRLAKLEILLETVRAEATKSTGPARLRLEHIEKLVTTRITTTRASLKASVERLGQTLAESKKSVERLGQSLVESKKTVEREVGLLTRGLKAGVRASRDALRGKRDS